MSLSFDFRIPWTGMTMANERQRFISIMIVPEDGTIVRKWRLTNKRFAFLKATVVVTGVFLLIGIASMISLALMYGKVREYERYNARLIEATGKLSTIASRLERYEVKERKLRAIIGSDFQLPSAMNIENVDSDSKMVSSSMEQGTDEFGRLLKRQEDRMRLIPSIWPVNAWKISKEFRNTGNPRLDHYGIDILAPKNSSVFATADGRVVFAGFDRDYGNMVVIDHGDNGWVTKYGHNESLLVKEGDYVLKGQTIAIFGGSEGSSTGVHLHYEMYFRGKPENPLEHLPDKPGMKVALQVQE